MVRLLPEVEVEVEREREAGGGEGAGGAAGRGGIENDLSKQLYLRMFPEISSASHVIEVKNRLEPAGVGPQNSIEWESMKRDHRNYVSISVYFGQGRPVYSAKGMRFRTGHPRSPIGIGSDSRDDFEAGHECTDSAFIWTYTSISSGSASHTFESWGDYSSIHMTLRSLTHWEDAHWSTGNKVERFSSPRRASKDSIMDKPCAEQLESVTKNISSDNSESCISQNLSSSSWTDAQRCMSLYFAMCTEKHSLFREIFCVYKSTSNTVKQAIHCQIPILVLTIGSSSELLETISDPPTGSEHLLMQDVEILDPMLSYLPKDEVLLIFPRLVYLPLDKFQAALGRILQVEQIPLPLLFMRTVLQAIGAFPALVREQIAD
ncbi:hypothetical protein Vadar_030214 [Vaccinium darrowii]|uniref:Uncharacterized protein n=1 Tax=Vaccinium darrowii TaxID=229202 RepID=A0ACB7XLQ9_9ERIC|nr:hypothetical protein Vadar_030214 [Vaccinium darrowii]